MTPPWSRTESSTDPSVPRAQRPALEITEHVQGDNQMTPHREKADHRGKRSVAETSESSARDPWYPQLEREDSAALSG